MQSTTPCRASRLASVLGTLLLSSGLLAAQGPLPKDGPTAKEIAAAGELFASSCSMCHLPPDPDHGTDVAWLKQVTDTA